MLVWHTWAPGLPEPSCRHLLLKLAKSSSLASSERVPLALSVLVHPKMWLCAEGLPSGVSFSEASLQLLPCACAPAAHFGCQQSSLGGSPCRGAAFDPYMDEPPVRPVVLPKDPPSMTGPVRPDSMVWPRWPNPIVYFFSRCRFSSWQRQGKACWKLKPNEGKFCSAPATEFSGTAFHWQKWQTKLWPALFRKWRKNTGLETALQWQRSFFKRNDKSISGWKAYPASQQCQGEHFHWHGWDTLGPCLGEHPSTHWRGMDLANLFSLVWFGFCCSVLGPRIFKRKCLVSGAEHRGLQCGRGGELLCPHGFLKEGEWQVTPGPGEDYHPLHLLRCPTKALHSRGAK